MTEFQFEDATVEPRYICDLCQCKMDVRQIIPHVTGIRHRQKYFVSSCIVCYLFFVRFCVLCYFRTLQDLCDIKYQMICWGFEYVMLTIILLNWSALKVIYVSIFGFCYWQKFHSFNEYNILWDIRRKSEKVKAAAKFAAAMEAREGRHSMRLKIQLTPFGTKVSHSVFILILNVIGRNSFIHDSRLYLSYQISTKNFSTLRVASIFNFSLEYCIIILVIIQQFLPIISFLLSISSLSTLLSLYIPSSFGLFFLVPSIFLIQSSFHSSLPYSFITVFSRI